MENNTKTFMLRKKILIKGEIRTVTGLRIGGSSSAMSIGGLDNIIIRNPVDNKPYIPGSSLKGKMRSLLEQRDGTIGVKPMGGGVSYGPSQDPDSLSCQLFGNSAGNERQQPSRIIVRDSELLTPEEEFKNADVPYAEVKTEVVIDRITSSANPRPMERVPAGATFNLELVINIFENHSPDKEIELVKTTFDCLRLLEDDYLGGSGSRGYGQVKFHISSVKERSRNFYFSNSLEDEKPYLLAPVPDSLKATP